MPSLTAVSTPLPSLQYSESHFLGHRFLLVLHVYRLVRAHLPECVACSPTSLPEATAPFFDLAQVRGRWSLCVFAHILSGQSRIAHRHAGDGAQLRVFRAT
jgi:hypothetical protein